MSLGGILFTHAVARRTGKPPYFFSRFNFERMKEQGNTHFCFHCLSDCGFKPGPNGEVTNSANREGQQWMQEHDETHASGILGNADRYKNVWDWLKGELPDDFPLIVHVPSTL